MLGLAVLASEAEYVAAAKAKWDEENFVNKLARVWVSLMDDNSDIIANNLTSLDAVVNVEATGDAFVNKENEVGGWLQSEGGAISSSLDWTVSSGGGSVTPSLPMPADAIGDIHSHPFFGNEPSVTIVEQTPPSGGTFSYTNTNWQTVAGSDSPTKPDLISFVVAASVSIPELTPPISHPERLYRYWWLFYVGCDGKASKAKIQMPAYTTLN
jgi:hypothetical protein